MQRINKYGRHTPPQVEAASCEAGAGPTQRGEVFGPSSRCVLSSLGANSSSQSTSSPPAPACYIAACAPDASRVTLTASLPGGGAASGTCSASQVGSHLSLPGFGGVIVCPDTRQLCGPYPGACASLRFAGVGGSTPATLGIGLAAAACVALAFCVYTPLCVAAHRSATRAQRAEAAAEAAEAAASAAAARAEASATVACALCPRPGHALPCGCRMCAAHVGQAAGAGAQCPVCGRDLPENAHALASIPPPPPPTPPTAAAAPQPASVVSSALLSACRGWVRSLRGHPLALSARSFMSASASAASLLSPGDVVIVRQYAPSPGWGAALLRCVSVAWHTTGDGRAACVAHPEAPPPPLPPFAGWSKEVGSQFASGACVSVLHPRACHLLLTLCVRVCVT